MNFELPIKESAVVIICGIFFIMMFSLLTVFPDQTVKEEMKLLLKGPRPYKPQILDLQPDDTYPQIGQNKHEHSFYPIIFAAADRYDVDPALVKAVIMAESSYNPMAISKKGAIGLMQLMPTTAAALGVEDSLNPEHNIDGGVKYLKKLLKRFGGDLKLALAAYNAGSKKVKEYNGVPPYKNTQKFVKKVFHYYEQYKKKI